MTQEEILLCKEKIKYGDQDAIILLANYYLENGEEVKAFLTISRFEYLDSTNGFKKLAFFYERGIGTEVDFERAIYFYKKAYDKGDTKSGYNIALLYFKRSEYDLSFPYLCEGKMNGHIPSIKLLSLFYEKGLGVDKNIEIAIKLLEEALNLGDYSCYDRIGKIYYQNEEYYQAVINFQKGYEKLDYDAIYHLAICYSKGQGVPLDIAKAIYLYEIGANNNHLGCINNLIVHYENGIGVKQNLEKSKQLREKLERIKNAKNTKIVL